VGGQKVHIGKLFYSTIRANNRTNERGNPKVLPAGSQIPLYAIQLLFPLFFGIMGFALKAGL